MTSPHNKSPVRFPFHKNITMAHILIDSPYPEIAANQVLQIRDLLLQAEAANQDVQAEHLGIWRRPGVPLRVHHRDLGLSQLLYQGGNIIEGPMPVPFALFDRCPKEPL